LGLLDRLFGRNRARAGVGATPTPSRAAVAGRLNLLPGLREFVAGTRHDIGGDHPAEDLARAATWLTYLGDRRRGREAWQRAAIASLPAALLNDPRAPGLARVDVGPLRAGTESGIFTALGGDPVRAVRLFQRTAEVYAAAGDAGPGTADWPLATLLAYCWLRGGALDAARAALATVPGIHNRPLADALRVLAGPPGVAGEGAAAGGALLRLAREEAEAQPYALDLQRAFPRRAPAVLPPPDLGVALDWEDAATERRRARPWRGDVRLLDGGRWLLAQSYDVLRNGAVDGAAVGRLILPGSSPPAVNREGIAGILRDAARSRALSPVDEAAALAALDRGDMEIVVFAGGAPQPFAPALSGVDRLRTPDGRAIPIRFVTDPGG
jgi:hypothetical protein